MEKAEGLTLSALMDRTKMGVSKCQPGVSYVGGGARGRSRGVEGQGGEARMGEGQQGRRKRGKRKGRDQGGRGKGRCATGTMETRGLLGRDQRQVRAGCQGAALLRMSWKRVNKLHAASLFWPLTEVTLLLPLLPPRSSSKLWPSRSSRPSAACSLMQRPCATRCWSTTNCECGVWEVCRDRVVAGCEMYTGEVLQRGLAMGGERLDIILVARRRGHDRCHYCLTALRVVV